MTPPEPGRRAARADLLLAVPMLALLAFVVWRSLGWRMRHDLPMMMYQAFLIDRLGYVPYRDFFDMNLPGTYATYAVIAKVFGYGDLGLRLADLSFMAAIGAITFALLRRVSVAVAVLAPTLFFLHYLRLGGELTLQREYMALVPVGLGLLATVSESPLRRRAFLAGLAFGCAATYKPHLAIGALPVAGWLAWEGRHAGRRQILEGLGLGTLGLALPIATALAVLAAAGVLGDFGGTLEYLRYYSHLSGEHRALEGSERLHYLLSKDLALGGATGWIVAGGLGFAHAMANAKDDAERSRLGLLASLLPAYVVYPTFSGQFWPYHWLPALFFATMGVACLVRPLRTNPIGPWLAPRMVFALLALQLSQVAEGLDSWDTSIEHHPAEGRPDRIAAYLKAHLRPGETVQPFDWILGGVCQGLLEAQARPATSFLYTFHFYHHVTQPFIQDLRARFMTELVAAPPAYVVVSHVHWPFVRGPDTATTFPAFDAWLAENYVLAPDFHVEDVEMWESKSRYSR